MPDQRVHRGPHPEDAAAFAPEMVSRLRQATADLSWLLSRGYAEVSALKIVGDRFALTERQRMAVRRCACADEALRRRGEKRAAAGELAGRRILLDGYNVLITVEAALAGAVILAARDGCYRDLASMHGTFRHVQETAPAVLLVGERLAALGVSGCTWYLDSPVSNSGRLKDTIQKHATERGWSWQVELVASPDKLLSETEEIVGTADSIILDRCRRWFNLAREVVSSAIPSARVVDLAVG